MSGPKVNIEALSFDERLDLVEELWNSLAAAPDSVPLTTAQRSELDRRLDEAEADGGIGLSWDEVVSRIHRRNRNR